MEPIQDYFSLPEGKPGQHRSSWGNEWANQVSPWEPTTPVEMPIWQYTTAALQQSEQSISYYLNESPVSPYPRHSSSLLTPGPSPHIGVFTHDARFAPLTPVYEPHHRQPNNKSPPHIPQLQIVPGLGSERGIEDVMEDDDSEGYVWEATRSPNSPPSASSSRRTHSRSQSANEVSLKNAKRAHTVVERNYRERLNDKIADLALYLFETSSDSRAKPSKSLVMTRAKERLKQLEARNKTLEAEVTKLRQHIAILDHIVAAKTEDGASTS